MSLLTLAQAVAQETGLLNSPSGVVASTDPGVVQLFALIKRSATEMMMAKDWQRLVRTQTITTVDGTSEYALPSDWDRYISETAWDVTNYWPMRGSLDPQYWESLKRGLVVLTIRRRYRVMGNQISIIPTPTADNETLILEYIRNTPWTSADGATFRTAPTADTDLSVFPQHVVELDVKWRLKHAKGLDYSEDKIEAENAISQAFAQDKPAMIVNYGYPSNFTPPFYPVVPSVIT